MAFVTGQQVTPSPRTGQEPVDLMEGLTPSQAASLVPYIKIIQLDPRTGREVTGLRPLMYDLIQNPQFGPVAGFGSDPEEFRERGLVTLSSLRVQTQMEYGFISYSKVNLEFIVHQPQAVFDRGSNVQWRALLEEGTAFSLEYGWRSDPGIVFDNPVFNGEGHEDLSTGQTIRPTRLMMLAVVRYNIHSQGNAQAVVTIEALENGDIALRETRLIDVIDDRIGFLDAARAIPDSDARAAAGLNNLLNGLDPHGRKYFTVGQVLGDLIYPLIDPVCQKFGYDTVDMFVGNFNADAGRQTKEYGSQGMALRSIADFQIPVQRLKDLLTFHPTKGISLRLHDMISTVIEEINGTLPWDAAVQSTSPGSNPDTAALIQAMDGKPNVALQARTIRDNEGVHLILTVLDRKEREHQLKGLQQVPIDRQTRSSVFDQLLRQNIPIIEFGRANSLILEANFEIQPDPLFQSILVDRAYRDRKDRVQQTAATDAQTRAGLSLPQEVIPLSILEGTITFLGNFIFETYSPVWIEYFGSAAISGIYHVLERMDVLEAGKFTTEVRFISEGIDPLNTRRRLNDTELAASNAANAQKTAPKGSSR